MVGIQQKLNIPSVKDYLLNASYRLGTAMTDSVSQPHRTYSLVYRFYFLKAISVVWSVVLPNIYTIYCFILFPLPLLLI